MELTADLNPDGDPVETSTANNRVTTQVSFETVPTQTLVLYSVGYGPADHPYYPQDIDRTQLTSWLQRAYPLSDVEVIERRYFAGAGVPTCGQVNSYLLSKRLWDLAQSATRPSASRTRTNVPWPIPAATARSPSTS